MTETVYQNIKEIVVFLLILSVLFFLNSCDNEDLPNTFYEPIGIRVSNEENQVLLIGTWYLETLYGENQIELVLNPCEKKRNVTYQADGTCIHRQYNYKNDTCSSSNIYSCTYFFELDIITSTSKIHGTTKAIVKFTDSETLEVFSNLGIKIVVYRKGDL